MIKYYLIQIKSPCEIVCFNHKKSLLEISYRCVSQLKVLSYRRYLTLRFQLFLPIFSFYPFYLGYEHVVRKSSLSSDYFFFVSLICHQFLQCRKQASFFLSYGSVVASKRWINTELKNNDLLIDVISLVFEIFISYIV